MTYDGGAFTPGGGLRAGAAEELGLTEEQRARIAAIFQESWPERVALMDEMHELRVQQLRERTPNFEAMAPLRERMFALNRATRERVDTVLTDEQRERLNDAWWGFGGRWR